MALRRYGRSLWLSERVKRTLADLKDFPSEAVIDESLHRVAVPVVERADNNGLQMLFETRLCQVLAEPRPKRGIDLAICYVPSVHFPSSLLQREARLLQSGSVNALILSVLG